MNKRGPKVDAMLGPLQRQTVLLDGLAIEQLKVVGDGNLSDGCRKAARIAYERYQRTPDTPLGSTK